MPKSMVVDPSVVRRAGKLEIASIPVNQYAEDFKAERERFGSEGLKRIWLDMVYIREFESMLNTFKIQGSWRGIEYNHKGPAHLSIGQEGTVGRPVREPRAFRLHLRLASEPRRDPRQVSVGLA